MPWNSSARETKRWWTVRAVWSRRAPLLTWSVDPASCRSAQPSHHTRTPDASARRGSSDATRPLRVHASARRTVHVAANTVCPEISSTTITVYRSRRMRVGAQWMKLRCRVPHLAESRRATSAFASFQRPFPFEPVQSRVKRRTRRTGLNCTLASASPGTDVPWAEDAFPLARSAKSQDANVSKSVKLDFNVPPMTVSCVIARLNRDSLGHDRIEVLFHCTYYSCCWIAYAIEYFRITIVSFWLILFTFVTINHFRKISLTWQFSILFIKYWIKT